MEEKRKMGFPSLVATGVLVLALFPVVQSVVLAPQPLATLIPPPQVLSSNTAMSESTRYNLNTGAAFNVSCSSIHTTDAFTVSFYKDGVVISDGDLVDTTLREIVFSPNQRSLQLEFLNFQPVHDGVYHCTVSTTDTNEEGSSDLYLYGSEFPPPLPVRVSPRYIVLDTSADLVLEARFRGNFHFHDWVYSEDDPYLRGFTTFFLNATRTNVGQTFTIPAGSAIIKAGYFGPRILPTSDTLNQLTPTPENAVIVGPFIAPTASINGLTTAQVTAAAGDEITFTCLARGFPETTITIQLSGVNASYTIGNQTLMTEATPTSSMEVNRTVTLHSVTVLDCGAVVTCVGSNMNSDGSTHTDQAAATLLLQAPPSVGVAPSVPLLSVGDPLTLTCMGKGCMTAFNFTWLFEGSPVNDSLVTVIDSTTSQLSVTSVTSSDFGKYTCQVTNVYGIGTAEVSVRDAASQSVLIIQLHLRPVFECLTWVDSNTEAKLSDISAALSVSLQQDCSCSLAVQQSLFSCLGTEDSQTVVFLARLSYTALPGVDLPSLLTAWVGSTPPITVASTQLQVDTTCPVVIGSLEPESCVINTPPPDVSVIAAAAGGSVAVFLIVLIIVVAMVIVGSVYFKRSRSKRPRPLPIPEYEYEYMGSGSGGVAIGSMTQNPSYQGTIEAVPSATFGAPEEVESKGQEEGHYDVIPPEASQEAQEEASNHDETDDEYVIA